MEWEELLVPEVFFPILFSSQNFRDILSVTEYRVKNVAII